jgi:hypothetical protein
MLTLAVSDKKGRVTLDRIAIASELSLMRRSIVSMTMSAGDVNANGTFACVCRRLYV